MKILSIINISNEQDLTCDSGFIFQRVIASELTKLGCEYHIAGSDCKAFKKIESTFFIKHYISNGTNRYSSRYNFNFEEFDILLEKINPDIVFNCQIELTAAIKSVLEFKKYKIPLISYCHYPALWNNSSNKPLLDETLNGGGIGLNIVMNILTAVSIADKVLIQSNFAKNLIEKAMLYYNIPYFNKIGVISPPLDDRIFDGKNHYLLNEAYQSFLYNHRLYKSYGSEIFIELGEQIYSEFNLSCNVFDSMPNRSISRSSLNKTPEYYKNIIRMKNNFHLINGNVPRDVYKRLLLQNLFALGAFRNTCVWSMASLDCSCIGIPVIAPNYASYNEFIPEELLFNDTKEAMNIIHNLINDDIFRSKMSKKAFAASKKFKADVIAKKLLNLFKKERAKKCAE